MNSNKKKLLWIILIIAVILAMVAVIIFLNLPEKEYTDKYLKEEKYSVSIQKTNEEYFDNEIAMYDEQGNKINKSDVISYEKFIFNNKIGIYGFNINADIGESTLTYTIKNHSTENQEAFKYRLQLINSDGSVEGIIDLESKAVPSLGKYKVTLNIDSDISDVYDIVPITDFETYGLVEFGGGDFES